MSERENYPNASHTAFPYFFTETEGIYFGGIAAPTIPGTETVDSVLTISERNESSISIGSQINSSLTIK